MATVGSHGKPEQRTFIDGSVKYADEQGCCSSRHTKRCCLATGIIGSLLLLIGLILMLAGRGLLEGAILKSMALKEGSGRTDTWLTPEKMNIKAHLTGYGFHVNNPDEVAKGGKPDLTEVGPFVYQALTIKDTVEEDGKSNLHYNEDGSTLTYRPRRFYFLDREQSVGNPDTTYLTVPNIPLLTGFHKIRGTFGGMFSTGGIALKLITKSGRGTPFVNVTFTELLWGYYDSMPCVNLARPYDCPAPPEEVAMNMDFDSGWDNDEDDDWDNDEDDDWKRKKRETMKKKEETVEKTRKKRKAVETPLFPEEENRRIKRALEEVEMHKEESKRMKREAAAKWRKGTQPGEDVVAKVEKFRRGANYTAMWLPKMEWIKHRDENGEISGCDCEWGLFRDRNVTLRKAIKMNHGAADLTMKGKIEEYDNSPTLNWWQPGSQCDSVVGAQDSATLPPNVDKTNPLTIFIALMCRKITLHYEGDREYKGLVAQRFIPAPNALGSHWEGEDPLLRNEENKCYCMDDKGYPCFKSGVMNMGPCKTTESLPTGAPIALSYPHFYQADQSFRDAVMGMKPEKEKHQMFADIHPKFGFPLAFRPKFQLNAILRRDTDIPMIAEFPEQLVLPFLWAQDGFGEPSDEMAEAIKFGETAPEKLPLLGGAVLLVIGGGMVLAALSWAIWRKRQGATLT